MDYITCFVILVGSRVSEANLDSKDCNDHYLSRNQNETDTKFSSEDILRDFNGKSSDNP